MQVHQHLSILFYRKKKKASKTTGLIPLYCRVTIDGLDDEISTGCKILYDDWDTNNKSVLPSCRDHKAINKKLGQMKTDLQRHFDLVVAKNGLATPQQVFASYQTPIKGHKQRAERQENAAFSVALDELIAAVVRHLRKAESLERKGPIAPPQILMLTAEKTALQEQSEKLAERGRKMWDDTEWEKTLLVAINELVFHFLELVLTGERARTTFSKIITAKARILEFTSRRYKKEDVLLASIEQSYIEDFTKHIMKFHQNSHNTVWKYVQILKEIIDRAFTKGWMATNPFGLYTWSYKEPEEKIWPRWRRCYT